MVASVREKGISSESVNMAYSIKTFNKIAQIGLDQFSAEHVSVDEQAADPHAIVLRSHKLHDMTVNPNLLAIGRAGAGVNNIPVDRMSDDAVVVFNAPGANANAVKELVLMGLLLSSRDIIGGINFSQLLEGTDEEIAKAVEKNKSRFGGGELQGKALGVIGLGAIGSMVANAALNLGMKVHGFDPYISIDWAWSLSRQVKRADSLERMLSQCDYVSLNVPLTDGTRGYLDAAKLKHLKPGATVVNFARPEIIVEADIAQALDDGTMKRYLTDFPSKLLLSRDDVISIPHLGASTKEAEDNCAIMIANQVQDFLLTGNIKNSVNFPVCQLEPSGQYRLAITNKNVPTVLGNITSVLADHNLNISEMLNKSRGDIAYTLIDIDQEISSEIVDQIKQIDGIIRTRLITLKK